MQDHDFPQLRPSVVLGIAAHPDDLDYGAAGTLALFASQGAAVHYLILTDGSKGTEDPDITTIELVKIRETEQKEAVRVIGGSGVTFLGYPDGGLEVTQELKKEIVKVIRTIKPDVVVTTDPSVLFSPARGFINHPDHRAAGQAALDAVFPLARDHLAYPDLYAQGYLPHKTKTVLLTNFDRGNFDVDISATFETKIAALKAHASQIGDPVETSAMLRERAKSIGKEANYELAESFTRIDVS